LDPNRPVRLIGLLLALLTVLVYLPVWSHGYMYLDDYDYVSGNDMVQPGLTWAGFQWAFVGWHASNWHPLTWLSHQLDCQLFGLNPGAHHLVNVLYHAANAVLLFLLWWRLTKACWPSAVVAALFAWHPLHVESVAWVAERKDVLSTFFGLLALLAYVRYAEASPAQRSDGAVGMTGPPKTGVFYAVSLASFALALLAKPMLVTLPGLLLLLDYWPLRRGVAQGSPSARSRTVPPPPHSACRLPPFAGRWRPLLIEKTPFFLLSGLSCAVTFFAQRGDAVRTLNQVSPGLRLENAVVSAASYLVKTLWPVNLGVFYPLPLHYPVGEVAGAAAMLTVVTLLVWRWRHFQPCLLTGWLWFLIMLLPVIGLVQVGDQAMADRYTYLPAVGLFVAVVFGLSEARERLPGRERARALATILILAASVALTERQLAFWSDSETLFLHTLKVTQYNAKIHIMLGAMYEYEGRTDESRQQYSQSQDCLSKTYLRLVDKRQTGPAQTQLLLGQEAEQRGDSAKAMANYRAALQLDDSLVEAHNNLGNLLDEQGQPEAALEQYQAAVRLQPQTPLVHENLGTELAGLGRFADALREYQTAAHLAPTKPEPHYLMGKAWLRQGQSGAAVAAFQDALRLASNDVPSLVYLARVLASDPAPQFRDGARAVSLAAQANTLTGGAQPFVLGTLAMAYAEAGRFEEARKTAREALARTVADNGKITAGLQLQLRLYEASRPFREPLANPPSPTTPP
jgi:tetratricopeptide (TPR) repeat protein